MEKCFEMHTSNNYFFIVSAFCVLSVRISESVTVVFAPSGEGTTSKLSIAGAVFGDELLQDIARKPVIKNEKNSFITKDLIKEKLFMLLLFNNAATILKREKIMKTLRLSI